MESKKIQPVKKLDELKTTNSLEGTADAFFIVKGWQKKYGLGGQGNNGSYGKRVRTPNNYEK